MKVLIVDSVKDERARLVEAFFQSPEIVVIGAVARLHTALHALGEDPPDVIVTDNNLGDDHASHLIVAARRCILPPAIVVFSTDDSLEERRRCLEAGADRFVAKSTGIPALERAIADAHASRMLSRPSSVDRFSLIGRVAAGVAHDLNNYLGVIDVSLGLLKKRLAGSGVTEEIASLRKALESAIRLTSNMTRYARGSTPPYGAVDVRAVVQRVLEMFRRTLPNSVGVTAHLDDVPPVDGNELEIEQLVLNVLLNACDASPENGEVYVRVSAPTKTSVRFEIEDRGQGLADAPDDTLTSRSSKRDGVGLGLGIVRGIARRHNATLRLHGAEPHGTRVTVEFTAQHALDCSAVSGS